MEPELTGSEFTSGATAVVFSIVFLVLIGIWITRAGKTGKSVANSINPKVSQYKKREAKEHLRDIKSGDAVQGMKNYGLFLLVVFGILLIIGLISA
jgi:hypothetical protein